MISHQKLGRSSSVNGDQTGRVKPKSGEHWVPLTLIFLFAALFCLLILIIECTVMVANKVVGLTLEYFLYFNVSHEFALGMFGLVSIIQLKRE